jgi:hypothetical protein
MADLHIETAGILFGIFISSPYSLLIDLKHSAYFKEIKSNLVD